MGGLIILAAILLPCLLLARFLDNIYVVMLMMSIVWMGIVGFFDDYFKLKKNNKTGVRAWFKVVGQVGLGLLTALLFLYHEDISIGVIERNEDGQSSLVL